MDVSAVSMASVGDHSGSLDGRTGGASSEPWPISSRASRDIGEGGSSSGVGTGVGDGGDEGGGSSADTKESTDELMIIDREPPEPPSEPSTPPDQRTGSIGRVQKRTVIHNNPEAFAGSPGSPLAARTAAEAVPKSAATRETLLAALSGNFLFSALDPDDLAGCIDSMKPLAIAEGEVIIRQGDRGDVFFVLESGRAEVLVDDVVVAEYGSGGTFGELALMYDCERAATVRAAEATPCRLWTTDLRTFRSLLATAATSNILSRCEFLRRVPLLEPLDLDQINKLADALAPESFHDGEYIIKQGEQGDAFYLIQEGVVRCTQWRSATDASEVPLLTLSAGDYFGEMALMLEEPRAANCIAAGGPVSCLMLDRSKFFQLLGPIQTILQVNMRLRILKSVPLLSKLTDSELSAVADALCVQSFEDEDYIIRQGDEGSRFYMINEGEVRCTCNVPGTGEEREVTRLGKGDFFGERALLRNEPRAANVVAVGYVDCLVLERDAFTALLGPLEKILEREVRRRESCNELVVGRGKTSRRQLRQVELADLRRISTLGTGTFGRVKLVQHTTTNETYALKCMMKAQIAKSHQQRNILNEKNILMACDHPFILDLVCTYNTPDELCMLTELLLGGELWTYIYETRTWRVLPRSRFGGFHFPTALFYGGCVVLCLQYLHQLSLAYRDLKPENLLLGQDGYVKMIDFGFAKRIPFRKGETMQAKSFTLCGTPDYLAPELVLSRGHDKAVDYWALGCFLYELLVGRTPFNDSSQSEIFKKAIRSERSLSFPTGFDPLAEDLIRRLLAPNPAFRIGNLAGGVKEISEHAWFSQNSFDWDGLYRKQLPAPYVPRILNPLDTSHYEAVNQTDVVVPYTGSQDLFKGF